LGARPPVLAGRLFRTLAVFAVVPVAVLPAADFVLAGPGVAPPIVIPQEASSNTIEAAKTLADYVTKISGAKLAVIKGAPEPLPEHAVWVGCQPALKKLFPKIDFEFQHPEEILLAANGAHLVIAGRDRMADGKDVESGTANAVYTFLQQRLDVRWLWPGPLGEDLIKRDKLALAPFEYRFHPPFRQRKMWRCSLGSAGNAWFRRQRLDLDSLQATAGHAFTGWWEKYHEAHPDYFALQPDGSRAGYPKPDTVKLCVSNPRMQQQWLDDAEALLRANPARIMVSASPNDSSLSGHCVCPNCRAWDQPGAKKVTLYGQGGKGEGVILTDRYVKFASLVARGLRERLPGRETSVGLHAYGPYTTPPQVEVPDRGVAISYVGHFPLTTGAARQEQKQQWTAWSDKAAMMIYRPNLWYWCGGVWGLPEVAMTKMIEDFRFLAEHRCVGLSVDTWRQNWATQGPQYYVMAALAYDPGQDGEAVLRDYYRRGFGPAAGEIEKYWTLMERARDRMADSPDLQLGSRNRFKLPGLLQKIYTDEFLNEAEALLRQAEAKAATGDAVYGRRVAFVRSGLEFTRLMMQATAVMEKVRASRGKNAEAVRSVMEIWDKLKQLSRDAGPYAINYGVIAGLICGKAYMGGMQDYFGPPSEKFRAAAGLDAKP
jgi:hypothetical protein